jgi:hypothetical protein
VSVVCDYRFVTLATQSNRPNTLYAVAKGYGVHAFTADNIVGTSPAPPTNPAPVTMSFKATGLFTVSADSLSGYAAESNAAALGDQTDAFVRIKKFALDTGQVLATFDKAGNDSNDDLVFQKAANAPQALVYVTAQGTTVPRALYALNGDNLVPQVPDGVPFTGDGPARVAALAEGSVMLSLSDQAKIIRVTQGQIQPNFRIPVQFMPTGLAAVDADRLCVLNFLSNTISVIETSAIVANPPPSLTSEPPADLREFRQAMLDAYLELFSHLTQYLKDCFCEQFVVPCPDCKDTKLYLGCVEIKDGRVYNICNWTKRRYSKSVQTYDYWLSAIPVLPLLKKLLAEFCCKTL